MNNQSKGEASSTGRGVPTYCLWVCPSDGGWEAVHTGPYGACYEAALAFNREGDLTIQPEGFDPNA